MSDDLQQGECLFEPWFICQSRNWEVFGSDLRGQGLPSAPLQNNRPGLQLTRDSGNLLTPPPRHTQNNERMHIYYTFPVDNNSTARVFGAGTEQSPSSPIGSCRNVAMDYANRHVWEVMSDQDQEREREREFKLQCYSALNNQNIGKLSINKAIKAKLIF